MSVEDLIRGVMESVVQGSYLTMSVDTIGRGMAVVMSCSVGRILAASFQAYLPCRHRQARSDGLHI